MAIASHFFSLKNRIYISHRNAQNIASAIRISTSNKNNLRLFRFFNKLSTVLSCELRLVRNN